MVRHVVASCKVVACSVASPTRGHGGPVLAAGLCGRQALPTCFSLPPCRRLRPPPLQTLLHPPPPPPPPGALARSFSPCLRPGRAPGWGSTLTCLRSEDRGAGDPTAHV